MANTGPKSMLNETTGGGGVTENIAEKSSAISEMVLSGMNACSVSKTIVNKQQQHSHTTFSTSKQQSFTSLAGSSTHSLSTVNVSTSSSSSMSSSSTTSAALAMAAATAMSSIVMSSNSSAQHQSTSSAASSATQPSSSLRKTHTLSFLHNEDLLSAKLSSVSSSKETNNQFGFESACQQRSALTLSRSISFNDQRRHQLQRTTVQRTESSRDSTTDMRRKISILSPIYNLQGFDSSSDLSL